MFHVRVVRVADGQARMMEEAASRLGLDLSSRVRSPSIREAKRPAAGERAHG